MMATEPPSLHLVVIDGQRVKGTTKPAKPLSKAEGEAKLVGFLKGLEADPEDKGDRFWEEVAVLRAQAEHRAAKRRRG